MTESKIRSRQASGSLAISQLGYHTRKKHSNHNMFYPAIWCPPLGVVFMCSPRVANVFLPSGWLCHLASLTFPNGRCSATILRREEKCGFSNRRPNPYRMLCLPLVRLSQSSDHPALALPHPAKDTRRTGTGECYPSKYLYN